MGQGIPSRCSLAGLQLVDGRYKIITLCVCSMKLKRKKNKNKKKGT